MIKAAYVLNFCDQHDEPNNFCKACDDYMFSVHKVTWGCKRAVKCIYCNKFHVSFNNFWLSDKKTLYICGSCDTRLQIKRNELSPKEFKEFVKKFRQRKNLLCHPKWKRVK